ncbi:hypothetical protein B0H66DRAFT_329549 [Apodospora peruviana]|uniref:Uncharacterized protein n=1 Tax=Apodospora peruviana TaxID=516989 RepID=A0AAE0M1V4_9PEZI|nr:hypothetical protein B0H66DRAFT_329549 [Apodospora peruviana]
MTKTWYVRYSFWPSTCQTSDHYLAFASWCGFCGAEQEAPKSWPRNPTRIAYLSSLKQTSLRSDPVFQSKALISVEPITMPLPAYIISRVADPIFGIFIGVSAAAMRINREQKTLGKTTQETIDTARR